MIGDLKKDIADQNHQIHLFKDQNLRLKQDLDTSKAFQVENVKMRGELEKA